MKAEFDPSRLDVETFAKAGATLDGTWPLDALPRLAASSPADEVPTGRSTPPVVWSARGESRAVKGGPPQVWLHVQADAEIGLECQRCLQPVLTSVAAERSFLFVAGEDVAAELDVDVEDDVLAITRALDVLGLIEDELLLALPLVPRHDRCPQPLPVRDDPLPADETPHPFAVLAALKRGNMPN